MRAVAAVAVAAVAAGDQSPACVVGARHHLHHHPNLYLESLSEAGLTGILSAYRYYCFRLLLQGIMSQ